MTRHALAHRQRVLAAIAEQAGGSELRANANEYELMLAALDNDRRRLKQIQSREAKAVLKRELLPAYAAWCDGVLAGNSGRQDDVFMTILLWQIDAGNFAAALPMAAHAIRHGMRMPDRFERTTACLIAEEMAESALREQPAAQASRYSELAECARIVESEDMPDEVRAKLCKALGYALVASAEAAADPGWKTDQRLLALEHLQRALQLHERIGVKKDIERLEREIRNTAGDTPPA